MDAGIAREVAVQQGTTSMTQARARQRSARTALTPVVPVADGTPQAQSSGDAQPETRAMLVGPDQRALELSYQLDRASNTWVARILDAESGEVVRQVPSKQVLHQLAELSPHPASIARVDPRQGCAPALQPSPRRPPMRQVPGSALPMTGRPGRCPGPNRNGSASEGLAL